MHSVLPLFVSDDAELQATFASVTTVPHLCVTDDNGLQATFAYVITVPHLCVTHDNGLQATTFALEVRVHTYG